MKYFPMFALLVSAACSAGSADGDSAGGGGGHAPPVTESMCTLDESTLNQCVLS